MTSSADSRSREGPSGVPSGSEPRCAPLPWSWLVHLLLPGLCLVIGCNSLTFFRTREKPQEKVDRPVPASGVPPTLPGSHHLRIAPYIFLSDFKIGEDQPLFKELALLRDQVYKELLLPPGTATVQVYLFDTRDRYERYMKWKYPNLPPRRAFFMAQPRNFGGEELNIFTYWGDRIRQDLRHELTHALLHSVLREVPMWLDEGLAEYFELPNEKNGRNDNHIEVLRRDLASGAYKLNLARLEGLSQVDDMSPAEYREAWAWVHFMMHKNNETRMALLSYLSHLRTAKQPAPLGPRLEKLFDDPEKILDAYLTKLQADQPTVRSAVLQTPTVERR